MECTQDTTKHTKGKHFSYGDLRERLANLLLGHASEEARASRVGSDKPDEAYVGTRGRLEPRIRVL